MPREVGPMQLCVGRGEAADRRAGLVDETFGGNRKRHRECRGSAAAAGMASLLMMTEERRGVTV